MSKKGEIIWVTCAQGVDAWTSQWRHIIRLGYPTTACGSTGFPSSGHSGSPWRRNSTKAPCPTCVERAGER